MSRVDGESGRGRGGLRVRAIDLVDVFAYLVVLGVFIQLFPEVISESFLLALLTAVLFKVVLEVVVWVKTWIVGRIRTTGSIMVRVAGIACLLLAMGGSKLLVLELTALVFGGAVRLGGFFQVTALIACLMLVRAGTRLMLAPRARTDG